MPQPRPFSRWMPPFKREYPPASVFDWIGRIVLIGFGAWLVALMVGFCVSAPICFGSCVAAVVLYLVVCSYFGAHADRQLAEDRKGEDIGTFARAFDRRNEPFDPWVVRATWDALRSFIHLPIRPTDRFAEDYGISYDDLEIDNLLLEVAARSGHSLEGMESNPYLLFGPRFVVTVGDLVRLISWQPRIEESNQ